MKTKVVIFGTGAVASEAFVEFSYDSVYEIVAFTVDAEHLSESTFKGLPVVSFSDVKRLYPSDEYKMHVALGFANVNKLRAERYLMVKSYGYEFVNCISSRATIWDSIDVGENCQVGARAIVSPSAKIGNNVIIGTACIVPHDVVVKDHCYFGVGVNLSGFVKVGEYCLLGSNCTIRNNVTIAAECIVGAGSVILADTVERGVYISQQADLLPTPSDSIKIG